MLIATLLALAPLAVAQTTDANKRLNGVTTDHAAFASQTYDYIIVGGGTAGLVLANRLSANPTFTVGVIEAGLWQPDAELINVPGLFNASVGNATFDWNMATSFQPGLHNRSLAQPRGKIVGGTSALTYHNYNRGSKQEYDSWAELGNPGWDWDSIFPYFTKSDSVVPGDAGFLPGLDGKQPGLNNVLDGATSGPVHVGHNNNNSAITPWVKMWHESWLANGAYFNADPEGGNSTGLTITARTVDPETNVRVYAMNAYLEPVLNRTNLFVLTGAEATKVIFANESLPADISNVTASQLVATAVEYGTPLNVTQRNIAKAKIEVILSAGALKSPQLLELSGVGNKKILDSLNIETVLDLPEVGENLQDHLEWWTDFLLKEDTPLETWDVYRNDPARDKAAWEEYQTNKTGVYNSSPATLGFFPLQTFPDAFNVTDLVDELDKEFAAANVSAIRKKQFEIQRRHLVDGQVTQVEVAFVPKGGLAHSPYPLIPGRSYLTAITFVLRPFSAGSVHINSTNPFADPLTDPNYNEFSFDWKIAAMWTKFARQVMLTDPIGQYIDHPVQPPADTETLEQWDDFCRQYTISVFHPVGSTSMAPREIGGVLDPKMVVYGTKNLRVVDAGSMPINVAAHTVATIYAMAERTSDIIINDRRLGSLNADIRSTIASQKANPESP